MTAPTPDQAADQITAQQAFDHIQLRMLGRTGAVVSTYEMRAILAERRELLARQVPEWRPTFTADSAEQERLLLEFCHEIAGPRGKKGSPPDPVRLLEMAKALYEAERNDWFAAPTAAGAVTLPDGVHGPDAEGWYSVVQGGRVVSEYSHPRAAGAEEEKHG